MGYVLRGQGHSAELALALGTEPVRIHYSAKGGYFILNGLPAKPGQLTVSAQGYKREQYNVTPSLDPDPLPIKLEPDQAQPQAIAAPPPNADAKS